LGTDADNASSHRAWVGVLAAAGVLVLGLPIVVVAIAARTTECYWDNPNGSNKAMHYEAWSAYAFGPGLAGILGLFAISLATSSRLRRRWRYPLAGALGIGIAISGVLIASLSVASTWDNYCD